MRSASITFAVLAVLAGACSAGDDDQQPTAGTSDAGRPPAPVHPPPVDSPPVDPPPVDPPPVDPARVPSGLVGRYSEDTISLSYSMLEYVHRVVPQVAGDAAARLRTFLDREIGGSMASSIAFLSLGFAPGQERARFKMANDYGAGMSPVEGWSKPDIHAIADLCNQIIVRHDTYDKELAALKRDTDVGASWMVVKATTADPMIPTAEAADMAAAFLHAVRKHNPDLEGVSADVKREIIEFRHKFHERDLEIKPPPIKVVPPGPPTPVLDKFKNHFDTIKTIKTIKPVEPGRVPGGR